MSNTELSRFANDFVASLELQAQFSQAGNVEQVVSTARDAGYDIEEEETAVFLDTLRNQSGELTDDELDAVAGGGSFFGQLVNAAQVGAGLLNSVLNNPNSGYYRG